MLNETFSVICNHRAHFCQSIEFGLLQIDHERILPLYESDSTDEVDFIKEKFVKRQYYAREEHRNLLNRVKRGFSKQISKRVIMPITSIRAVQAFRRQVSRPQSTPAPAAAAAAAEA